MEKEIVVRVVTSLKQLASVIANNEKYMKQINWLLKLYFKDLKVEPRHERELLLVTCQTLQAF